MFGTLCPLDPRASERAPGDLTSPGANVTCLGELRICVDLREYTGPGTASPRAPPGGSHGPPVDLLGGRLSARRISFLSRPIATARKFPNGIDVPRSDPLGYTRWCKLGERAANTPRATERAITREDVMFTRAALAGAVLSAAAAVFGSSAGAHAAPVVFPSSAGGNDNSYEVIVDGDVTYPAAQSAAAAAGGHLVSITSSAEQSFVESLLLDSGAPTGSYYMALERVSIDAFKWSTGEPFAFQNFAGGEPNNFMGNELVGQIYWTDD